MNYNPKLIFDIGLHKGEDTFHYLKLGYNVVAVDANPQMVNYCERKFSNELAQGKLKIINAGIGNEDTPLPFYINLTNSEWSSFEKELGARNNTKYKIIDVPCISTAKLFNEFGIPYYMKVDIEGYDYLCLQDIPDFGLKPKYVSCEANDLSWLEILQKKGYNKFKLINQADSYRPMNLRQQKNWIYTKFQKLRRGVEFVKKKTDPHYCGASASGPFGEDSKGEWKSFDIIREEYLGFYPENKGKPINTVSWWDFHATFQ